MKVPFVLIFLLFYFTELQCCLSQVLNENESLLQVLNENESLSQVLNENESLSQVLNENEIKHDVGSCTKNLTKYIKSCTFNKERFTLDKYCNEIFPSNTCQNYFKNFIQILPECQYDENLHIIEISHFVRYKTQELYCTKDESGNSCPLATLIQAKKELNADKFFNDINKAISDTCLSKICTEATIKYFENSYSDITKRDNSNTSFDIRNSKEISYDIYILEYLKSNQCITKYSNETVINLDITNNSVMKKNSFLLIKIFIIFMCIILLI